MKANKNQNEEQTSHSLQQQSHRTTSVPQQTTEQQGLEQGVDVDPRVQQWQTAHQQTERAQQGRTQQQVVENSSQLEKLSTFQLLADQSPQVQRLTEFQQTADTYTSGEYERRFSRSPFTQEDKESPVETDDPTSQVSQLEMDTNGSTPPSGGSMPPPPIMGGTGGLSDTSNIPPPLREKIETESGISLGDVIVHYDASEALELNVNAFAKGNEVFLAPGAEEYLEEELWHIVQQKQGIVKPTGTENGMPINDSPGLESAARSGRVPRKGMEDTDMVREVIQKNDDVLVFYVRVEGAVTGAQLMALFEQQAYGQVVGSEWYLYEGTTRVAIEKTATYGEAGKALRYTMRIPAATYRAQRAKSSEGIGVEIDGENNIVGAADRSAAFEELPESTREPLLDEIDRRYAAISGKTDVENDEEQVLWDLVRDEVLAQRERVFNRSEKVNQVVRSVEEGGLVIKPEEYPRMLQLVQRLENMDDRALTEYASRTTATATSIEDMEESLDRFEAQEQERVEGREERTSMVNDLFGTNDIYDGLNVDASDFQNDEWISPEVLAVEHFEALEARAQALGFENLQDYEKHLEDYKESFWQESVHTGIALMQKYEHKLLEYERRYTTTEDAQELGRAVEQTQASELYTAASDNRRTARMGRGGGMDSKYTPPIVREIGDDMTAEAGRQERQAEALIRAFSEEHPIVGEASFDPRAFAGESPEDAKEFILDYIQEQKENVATVKSKMQSDKDYVFTLDNLMAEMFQKEGLSEGSVQRKIIQDHIQHIKDVEFWTSIGIAIVAIGLGIVSMGSGTVATLALVGGAALSVYDVSRELGKYSEEQAAHDVGLLSKDPSFGWVLLALVGAGLDIAAVAKMLKVGKLTESIEVFNDGIKTDPERALLELDTQLDQISVLDDSVRSALRNKAIDHVDFSSKLQAASIDQLDLTKESKKLLELASYARRNGYNTVEEFFNVLKANGLPKNTVADLTSDEILALRKAMTDAGNLYDGFRSAADPVADVLGAGRTSHPERWDEIITELRKENVEIVWRKDGLAYSPAGRGQPGQMILDENASISALEHEYRHFLDNKRQGFVGMGSLFNPDYRIMTEANAYSVEIKRMIEAGHMDVAAKLKDNFMAEVATVTERIGGPSMTEITDFVDFMGRTDVVDNPQFMQELSQHLEGFERLMFDF